MHILQVISTLEMLSDLTGMAERGLTGGEFIPTVHLHQARDLRRQAEEFKSSYEPFSESINALSFRLFAASANPNTASVAVEEIADILLALRRIQRQLQAQRAHVERAAQEASAKSEAAQNILKSSASSKTLAAVAQFQLGSWQSLRSSWGRSRRPGTGGDCLPRNTCEAKRRHRDSRRLAEQALTIRPINNQFPECRTDSRDFSASKRRIAI